MMDRILFKRAREITRKIRARMTKREMMRDDPPIVINVLEIIQMVMDVHEIMLSICTCTYTYIYM